LITHGRRWQIQKRRKPHDTERNYVDTYEPEALEHIIKTQHKVTEYMKEQKHKILYQICIIGDFADDPTFTHNAKLLHQLYIRGRHQMIAWPHKCSQQHHHL
jgi:hypothetical protein